MKTKEDKKFDTLSRKGQAAYAHDRAVECDATGGFYPKSEADLYAGKYDKM